MTNSNTLVGFGGAVKSLGDGKYGGYAVVFSDGTANDIERDYFDAKTDFDLEDGDVRTAYYNHGLDVKMGNCKVGKASFKMDEVGLWMEAQLESRSKYISAIKKMAENGDLGISTGAINHLVRREAKSGGLSYVTHWPIGEVSFTTTPMEPRTSVMSIKSFQASLKGTWLGANMEYDLAMNASSSLMSSAQWALQRSIYAGPYGMDDGDDDDGTGEPEGSKADTLTDCGEIFDELKEAALMALTGLLKDKTPEGQAAMKAFLISTAAASKSVSVVATVRDLEAFLRDAGLSRKVSAAVALHGFKGLQRDADESEVKTETHTPDIPKIEKRFADLDALKARLNAA